ncbi:MAG: glycosyltransferase [Candidatus Zambryskibacteria bacterium]|nr:glycosyltransferase [Candidatus Zambryskibacteria bacterium]
MSIYPETLGALTICTVSYGHRSLIETNIKFIKKINPNFSVNWVIVENTPEGKGDRFDIGETGNIKVIKGMENNFQGIAKASQHHASGLNTAIQEVKTRFALILDPDFYIVRNNWIEEVVKHMKKNNLAFFGAPYNPKRYLKYRYFPCIHCMFIDLEKVPQGELDFTPQYKV